MIITLNTQDQIIFILSYEMWLVDIFFLQFVRFLFFLMNIHDPKRLGQSKGTVTPA